MRCVDIMRENLEHRQPPNSDSDLMLNNSDPIPSLKSSPNGDYYILLTWTILNVI